MSGWVGRLMGGRKDGGWVAGWICGWLGGLMDGK